MANFLSDNPDLLYYVQEGIPWDELYAGVEPDPETNPYTDRAEAQETWNDILEMIGQLAAEEIAPLSSVLDRQERVLVDGEASEPEELKALFETIRQMELHGMCVPREFGGMNCPFALYLVQAELMARADVSVMSHHGFHGGIALAMLLYSVTLGSAEVTPSGVIVSTPYEEAVRSIVRGEAWGAMDITEPDAGSDMGALRARGEQDDEGNWFVTGQKIFITSGHGRWHFVIARTEGPERPGLEGLSLFLVETYTPSPGGRIRHATLGRLEEKLGHHASVTATIDFDRSPAQIIGERGDGFRQMLQLMNGARILVGFECLGLMEASRRMALAYAGERRSMGKTLDQHEMVADVLDRMQSDIEGLRALCFEAGVNEERARRKQLELACIPQKDDEQRQKLEDDLSSLRWKARLVTPLVKLAGSEMAVTHARECLQIHGGYGYSREYGAEKLLRDALVLPIYEGTTQIQALMATKDALQWVTKNPSTFVGRLSRASWRRRFASGVERDAATVEWRALKAQQHLMTQVIGAKLGPPSEWKENLTHWDPKQDFGPALLHAEHLAWMLYDAAVCRALQRQVREHPHRLPALERHVERALPRSRDLLYRIRTSGARILSSLQSPSGEHA